MTDKAEQKNWEQLSSTYKCPAWYAEGKLGIWTHWGPQAHPLRGGGWYARHMYMQDVGDEKWGRDAYEFQNENFGHPSKAGYKEVLNDWKTPELDTDALLCYFKNKLGAKYFMTTTAHHDHFDCWDSSHHPWNSVRVGPKRDIVGEFAASSKKAGLPFGVASHDDRYLGWWQTAFGADTDGPKKGIPYDGNLTKEDGVGTWWEGLDPADLYGLPPEKRTPEWIESVKENWLKRHLELIEKYDVDMVWFDGHNFPYGEYGRRVGERLFNNSIAKDGFANVVLAGKPFGMSELDKKGWIMDFERGVPNEPPGRTFQSITTLRSWFYKQDVHHMEPNHNARTLIELFCDVLSKGGNLMLNFELRGDGSMPTDLMHIYDDFGDWVNLNAEAIYATCAWKTPGDNRPCDIAAQQLDETNLEQAAEHSEQFNEHNRKSPPYPHSEVRYVAKGDKLFIYVLNPKGGAITLPSLGLGSEYHPGKISAIRLIGGGSVDFTQDEAKLVLNVPDERPNEYTAVFEVSGAIRAE